MSGPSSNPDRGDRVTGNTSDPSDIYDPAYVADLFDRCSSNYRWWSAVSSFGFIYLWRRQCVALLSSPGPGATVVDLMAGTGEVWPHVLKRFPDLGTITALDISHRMHREAVERLHGAYSRRITHIEANALETDLPSDHADLLISTFGLKTFNTDQQTVLARQIARLLKPGGRFALIEASDPKGWILRPAFRFYLDRALPQIERFFLNGAHDFSMIGAYTRNFGSAAHMADALRHAGLNVTLKRHFFGCATSVSGSKPKLP
jgi:ubiquinone/menaquinone biosynthesis C-methylase UbiE